MCASEFCTLQLYDVSVVYTIEKEVAVVNTASDYCVGHRYGGVPVNMFANAPKLAHVADGQHFQIFCQFEQTKMAISRPF